MDVEVRIDTTDNAPCQSGHCHPFFSAWFGVAPHQVGRRTRQRRACVAGSYEVTPSTRQGVEWVTGPGRRIERKTVPKDVSRTVGVRPGLGTHPYADQSTYSSGGSLSGHFNPYAGLGWPHGARCAIVQPNASIVAME